MADTFNSHIEDWTRAMERAKAAMERCDDQEYRIAIEDMATAYEEFQRDNDLEYNGDKSFGTTNSMFESVLPSLMKKNKGIIKKYVTMLKEDKNLSSQMRFINALKNYNPSLGNVKEYIKECLELASSNLDLKTLKESNNKLRSLLKKNDIRASEYLSEEEIKFNNHCNILLGTVKKLSTLPTITESLNEVASYIEKKYSVVNESIDDKINDLSEKIDSTLTESEKEFYSVLTSKNEKQQEKLFNSIVRECIELVSEMEKECNEDEKENIKNLKLQLEDKKFNSKTLVDDVIKLLEFKDTIIE